MKIGILHTSHPDPVTEPFPYHAVHARTTKEILEAEELGFDRVWIAEQTVEGPEIGEASLHQYRQPVADLGYLTKGV